MEPEPGPDEPKLLASPMVKLRVALAGGMTLVLGVWLAPPAAQTAQTVLTTPQEHVAPLLEEQVQRRQTEQAFRGVQDAAAVVRDWSVSVVIPPGPAQRSRRDYAQPDQRRRSGFGVIVGDRQVLTHADALAGLTSVEISGAAGTVVASMAAYEPSTGLVLLQTDAQAGTPVPMVSVEPVPGALSVGVGRGAAGDVVMPIYITSRLPDRYALGSVNNAIPPGLPVFTLSGAVFAIAAGADGTDALPIGPAVARLQQRVAAGERRVAIGVALQPVADLVPPLFGSSGVVVTEVVPGSPADRAEIEPGDVLLAIDDMPTDSIDAVDAVLTVRGDAPASRRVRFSRGEREREIELTMEPAYVVAAMARGADGPAGLLARTLFDASTRERASIPPGAQILAVDGRLPESRTQVERQLRGLRRAIPVLVRDGGQQYFVAIEPE